MTELQEIIELSKALGLKKLPNANQLSLATGRTHRDCQMFLRMIQ